MAQLRFGGNESTGDITLAVSPTGSNIPSANRPGRITSGDFSAYPFETTQAAINSLPKRIIGDHAVQINLSAGDFEKFVIEGFQLVSTAYYAFRVAGTREDYTPTQGPALGTATSGDENSLTLTDADWIPDELVGKFVNITSGSGAGQIVVIAKNTDEVITFGGYIQPGFDDTTVFQLQEITTKVNYGLEHAGVTLRDNSPGMVMASGSTDLAGRFWIQDLLAKPDVFGAGFSSMGTGATIFQRCVAETDSGSNHCDWGFALIQGSYGYLKQCCTYAISGYFMSGVNILHRSFSYLECFVSKDSTQGITLFDGSTVKAESFFIRNNGSGTGIKTQSYLSGSESRSMLTLFGGGYFIDGCYAGIVSDFGDMVLAQLDISNTSFPFTLNYSNVHIISNLSGTGNGDYGLNAAGGYNQVRIENVSPTITGTNGDATVTAYGSSDDATAWDDFDASESFIFNAGTGSRIHAYYAE